MAVFLRRLSVALDRSWTPPLPISTYLIEHPEGYVLFGYGESPHTMEPGYFPTWMPFFHLAVDMYLRQHEGIGARLQQRNLQASCVTLWSQDLDTSIQSVLEMRARLEAIFISEAVLMGYQHSYPPTMLSLRETFHLRSYSYSSILTWMHPPNPEYTS
ncbi:hypothetical protein BKA56DRAFT_689501 [Ilyonectria sp. MPI-CAGE-AT-0026]|nr:hypothetical protein BKA56DRAFT_689501 [Ilyonectria sp. MPI-CAGE-AT-0026]